MESEIIYQHNRPYGIRNKNGYLLFFPQVRKFDGQEARYKQELSDQRNLAEYILDAINLRT